SPCPLGKRHRFVRLPHVAPPSQTHARSARRAWRQAAESPRVFPVRVGQHPYPESPYRPRPSQVTVQILDCGPGGCTFVKGLMIRIRFSTTNPSCMSSEYSTEASACKALDTIVLSQKEKVYCTRKAEAFSKSTLLNSSTIYLA